MALTSHTASVSKTASTTPPAIISDRQTFTFNNHSCPGPVHSHGEKLLAAIWRGPELAHQIGTLDRRTGNFRNIPIENTPDAMAYALRAASAGLDVFFACAEYLTPDRRVAASVSGAFAFWLDIDCGEDKASSGKGYKTEDAADSALRDFCDSTEIPAPTHIVSSGGGVHVYWVLGNMVERAVWQIHAKKLKALTHAKGLLADDSRTADIASVLRIPGTLNFKYEPPRPVVLKSASDEFIEPDAMLAAIDRAHANLCCVSSTQPVRSSARGSACAAYSKYGPPDLAKLASALTALNPDCDDDTWKLRRLAPLAGSARDYPECEETLRDLAQSWSSGELHGRVARAWITPGNNGQTGQEIFDETWRRFLHSHYSGIPVTIGTIFYDAKAQGWSYPAERFEKLDDAPVGEGK